MLQELLSELEKIETEFRNFVAATPEQATLSTYQRYKSLLFNVEQKAKDSLEPQEFAEFGKRMSQALQIIRNSYDKHVVRREVDKFMKNSNLEIEKVFEAEPYLVGTRPSNATDNKNLFRVEELLQKNLSPEFSVQDTKIAGDKIIVKLFDNTKKEFTTFEDNFSEVLDAIKKNITKEEIPSPQQQLAQAPKTGPEIKPVLAARGYRLVSKEEDLAIGERGMIDPNEKEEKPPTDAAEVVSAQRTEKLPLYIIERLEEKLYRLLDRDGNTLSYHPGFRAARQHLIDSATRGELETVQPQDVK